MKRLIILLTFGTLFVNFLNAQNRPTSQTNTSLNFENFLSGVKCTEIQVTPEQYKNLQAAIFDYKNYDETEGAPYFGLLIYLKSLKFENIVYSQNTTSIDNVMTSLCDKVKIYITADFIYNYYINLSLVFESCNGDRFIFKSDKHISSNSSVNELTNSFSKLFISMYGYLKPKYSSYNRLDLSRNQLGWNEYKLKEHWIKNGIDELEGIYEISTASSNQPRYKVALFKTVEGYNLIYLSGATYTNDWDEGELKAILIPTATSNFFKTKWYMANKTVNDEWYISFEQGIMKLIDGGDNSLYVKMYPTANDNLKPKGASGTGTGVAIASNGLIVTNYHVIAGASTIKVKGINGDFSKSYIAKVLTFDEKNDLAIIKIDDVSFSTLGTPPFCIKSVTSEVGSDIFVLGYPLTATMGDEIKLTNGIISAKSGFQGDITSYQMTAAIQPGNSGAPLFDKNGYLIGVVNSKHIGAESVGYAIKSSYLKNLIESLTPTPKLTTQNLLIGKPLTEQVKLIKKFVYIIETE